ncbi:MAG: selenide, water dikinase SelD [Candidatus Neomarinimicrobiota bacterium]|nr:selenide, water dikinase SelD [Candidatus Neomarinimicrobiota bacterium]
MGPGDLAQVLGDVNMPTDDSVVLSFDSADDAAAVRLDSGTTLVQTVDFFTPVVDDPYEFGQIAAANALSDIYAMGGKPLFALNIVGFPINDLPKSILTEILQGGADKAAEAGIPIVGGHSIDDKEPKYGLVVTGEVDEENMWTNSGAQPGDILILTKPLGTGIIATALKNEAVPEESVFAAIESMSTLNKDAVQALQGLEVHAVTDVTGYGLLGHLQEMCQASAVSGRIDFQNLEFLPGVQNLAEAGMIAGGTRRNLEYIKDYTEFDPQLTEVDRLLAADAQTSGGLLISMPQEDSEKFIAVFGPAAYQVGKIITRRESLVFLNN